MYTSLYHTEEQLKTAIADYENNLRNFETGSVKPAPGEVFANRLRLKELKELHASKLATA